MAGLEVVVRPVVFPDIRPQPARSLPPPDDPKQGFCEIKGSGAFLVSYSVSNSWSVTYGNEQEFKRRVDEARVSGGGGGGKNYVDIQVANKLWKRGPKRKVAGTGREEDPLVSGSDPTLQQDRWIEDYKKVQPSENVEILERNKIITNEDASQ